MDPASLHLLHKTRWVHHTRPVNPFTHLDQAIKVKKNIWVEFWILRIILI